MRARPNKIDSGLSRGTIEAGHGLARLGYCRERVLPPRGGLATLKEVWHRCSPDPGVGLQLACVRSRRRAGVRRSRGARDVQCGGVMTAVTVRNVTVPSGGSCILRNSTVTGRVSASAAIVFPGDSHKDRG